MIKRWHLILVVILLPYVTYFINSFIDSVGLNILNIVVCAVFLMFVINVFIEGDLLNLINKDIFGESDE